MRGAEKVLFGLDDVVGVGSIVVVEGEMDKLALEEAGLTNVVSVSRCGGGGVGWVGGRVCVCVCG